MYKNLSKSIGSRDRENKKILKKIKNVLFVLMKYDINTLEI